MECIRPSGVELGIHVAGINHILGCVTAYYRVTGSFILHRSAVFVAHDMAYIQVTVRSVLLQDNLGTTEVCQCQSVWQVIYKFYDFVVVVRQVQVCTPAEIIIKLLIPSCAEFESLVLYVTGVYITVAQSRFIRSSYREELILGICLIVCQSHSQSVLEECTVESHFDRMSLFRFQRTERSIFRWSDSTLRLQ